jgi:hypothetical protein
MDGKNREEVSSAKRWTALFEGRLKLLIHILVNPTTPTEESSPLEAKARDDKFFPEIFKPLNSFCVGFR